MLWLLLVLVFSFVGLVLYFLFGWSMHRIRRRYRLKEAKDRKGLEELRRFTALDDLDPNLGADLSEHSSLVRMLLANRSSLTSGNKSN